MSVDIETIPATEGLAPHALAPERLYRFSPEQYDAMGQHGILTPGDRVELLEGWIIHKMGKNAPHITATRMGFRLLGRIVPPGYFVAKEDPIRTLSSEPEPDLAVIRGDIADYADRKSGPADVCLVVEVADSSLLDDRSVKKRIYAEAGIPFYWIVNIPGRRLLVHSDPTGPSGSREYRSVVEFGPGDEVPLVLDGREVGRIAVRELLP